MIKCSFISFFLVAAFFCSDYCWAQDSAAIIKSKPAIDPMVYDSWPSLMKPLISNDGNFVSFVIKNVPSRGRSLVIKSTAEKWEMNFADAKEMMFSNDSKFAFILIANRDLVIVELGKSIVKRFSSIVAYGDLEGSKRSILVFQRDNQIMLYDFNKNKVLKSVEAVESFYISGNKRILVMVLSSQDDDRRNIKELWYLDVNLLKVTKVWRGTQQVSSVHVDDQGSQVAFLFADSVNGGGGKKCMLSRLDDGECKIIFDDQHPGIRTYDRIKYLSWFNKEGTRLFFSAEKIQKSSTVDAVDEVVSVWSYLDKKLRPLQIEDLSKSQSSMYCYDINSTKVNLLTEAGDLILNQGIWDDKLLILHGDPDADWNERRWNKAAELKTYMSSAKNGDRVCLNMIGPNIISSLSPYGKFVIFNDGRDYLCYEVATGKTRNITKNIETDWTQYYANDRAATPRGIARWLENDKAVLIYDRFDLWLLDPLGNRVAVNLTKGYGRRHNIVFSLAMNGDSGGLLHYKGKVVLTAVGLTDKKNGFYAIDLAGHGNLELLTFGDYLYNEINPYVSSPGLAPVKARDCEKYIVARMNATESMNFFLTSDFKSFTPLSNIHPEKAYNWYTTELHSYDCPDGKRMTGVLYKPENFDLNKRYPIIFHYYEKTSFDLNVCLIPKYSELEVNIPTYVSNGYLIFTPDIEYTIGDPMKGTYNSIVGAVNHLSQLPFIDTSRMGIQGHSFGGLQTNYLVANTNLFAAACTGSAISDMISTYGSISLSGGSQQGNFEWGGQFRMGGAPWDSTAGYIRNSPVLNANRVNTPLLMMHTTNDAGSPFAQAIEFYTALRSLGKRVWLLEYKNANHVLRGKSQIDFVTRMRQFFDHYLMGKPAPGWMTHGNPKKMKDSEDGL